MIKCKMMIQIKVMVITSMMIIILVIMVSSVNCDSLNVTLFVR